MVVGWELFDSNHLTEAAAVIVEPEAAQERLIRSEELRTRAC
jgi:hypothetical protein